MSRFASSAHHITSAVDAMQPCLPISPPITDSSDQHGRSYEDYMTPRAVAHDIPLSTSKKTSTLLYHTPSVSAFGHRDIRDKPIPRNRALIMVIPPIKLADEHGHLGHTLSSGPSHRLSHGMLMPLFPTVYAQLTAIAKEWAFPSIVGLCLYMHINEHGITFTPRICDDTWPLLWHHALDPSAPPLGLPIAGRIEFDIDLSKAKWFPSWSTSRFVEPTFISHSLDVSQDFSAIPQGEIKAKSQVSSKSARSRHLPKTLSLVDRYDITDTISTAARARVQSTVGTTTLVTGNLNEDLSLKVNQWKVDADMTAAEDVANEDQAVADVLNLADFKWSPSTLGPPSGLDDDQESHFLSPQAPSIHIDRRMRTSLCNTPSVCTSFGPDDDDNSHLSSPFALRTPYPNRYALNSYPNTPSTATTWGPPESSPLSPAAPFHVRTPDIASRSSNECRSMPYRDNKFTWSDYGSSTAVETTLAFTTQGVFSWPYYEYPVDEFVAAQTGVAFTWPYYSPSESVPISINLYPHIEIYTPVYPHVVPYPAIVREGAVESEVELQTRSASYFSARYPHFNLYPSVGYPHFDLYPQTCEDTEKVDLSQDIIQSNDGMLYPRLQIYAAVYPHVVPYPPVAVYEMTEKGDDLASASQKLAYGDSDGENSLNAAYPQLQVYSPVYPHILPYPSIALDEMTSPVLQPSSMGLLQEDPTDHFGSMSYPWLQIYAPVYPHILPYPQIALDEKFNGISSSHLDIPLQQDATSYPWFQIYPSVYPHVVPYPPIALLELEKDSDDWTESKTSQLSYKEISYPWMQIYAAVYPHIDPYPSIASECTTSLPPRPRLNPMRSRSKSISIKRRFKIPLNANEDPWPGPTFRNGVVFDYSAMSPIPAISPTDPMHRRHKSSELSVERPLPRTVSHLRAQGANSLERSKSLSSPTTPPPRPPRRRDSLALTMEKLMKARSLVPGSGSSQKVPRVWLREMSFFEDSDEE